MRINSNISQRNWLLLTLSICLLLRAVLVFSSDVNWDEFYFLHLIYQHQAGDLATVLQTFHVHFFKWLALVSTNEVYQVFAARSVMSIFAITTLLCIYAIARKFFSQKAALASVIGYCAISFIIEHGTSFRADTIAISLLMLATWLAVKQSDKIYIYVFLGVMIGIAGLITIKAIFFAPMIGLIFLHYCTVKNWRFSAFMNCFIAFVAALITFVCLYLWHKSTFPVLVTGDSSDYLSNSIQKLVLSSSIFPQSNSLIYFISNNFSIFLILFFGIFICYRKLNSFEFISLLAFLLPLLSIIFYRNSFSYYYTMILAPACIFIAPAFDYINEEIQQKSKRVRIYYILAVFMLIQFGTNSFTALQRTPEAQIATLNTVHKMFPSPVNYIDRNSIVASFPKQGFFMSTWGFEDYRENQTPIFKEILSKSSPKFLIGNVEALDLDKLDTIPEFSHRRLLKEDETVLRENYVNHWGKIYVAGKRFTDLAVNQETHFDILIEGVYTYEANVPASINGEKIYPLGKIFLNKDRYTIVVAQPAEEIILRFGKELYRPEIAAPNIPIYFGL